MRKCWSYEGQERWPRQSINFIAYNLYFLLWRALQLRDTRVGLLVFQTDIPVPSALQFDLTRHSRHSRRDEITRNDIARVTASRAYAPREIIILDKRIRYDPEISTPPSPRRTRAEFQHAFPFDARPMIRSQNLFLTNFRILGSLLGLSAVLWKSLLKKIVRGFSGCRKLYEMSTNVLYKTGRRGKEFIL